MNLIRFHFMNGEVVDFIVDSPKMMNYLCQELNKLESNDNKSVVINEESTGRDVMLRLDTIQYADMIRTSIPVTQESPVINNLGGEADESEGISE